MPRVRRGRPRADRARGARVGNEHVVQHRSLSSLAGGLAVKAGEVNLGAERDSPARERGRSVWGRLQMRELARHVGRVPLAAPRRCGDVGRLEHAGELRKDGTSSAYGLAASSCTRASCVRAQTRKRPRRCVRVCFRPNARPAAVKSASRPSTAPRAFLTATRRACARPCAGPRRRRPRRGCRR